MDVTPDSKTAAAPDERQAVKMSIDEVLQEREEIPTKVVTDEKVVDINCQICFVDFEGRADSQSVKQILAHVKPRQLVGPCVLLRA